MSPILIATLGGLAVLVFWGVSDWLIAKSSRKFPSTQVSLALRIPIALIGIFLLLSAGLPSLQDALILILAGLFFCTTYLIFIKALSLGETGVVVPIANTYPVFTLVLSSIFLGAVFTRPEIIAISIIVFGAFLLGAESKPWRIFKKHFRSGIILAIIAAFFWGVAFASVGPVIETVPWQIGVGLLSISESFFALLFWIAKNRRHMGEQLHGVITNFTAMSGGIMLLFGTLAFYISVQLSGNIVIPATIAAASPIITSLLARIFEHEKIILIKRIGAFIVVLGVILLNIK